MTRTDYRLLAALALSLSLHFLPFLPDLITQPAKPEAARPLQAELRSPPPPDHPQAPLKLPEPPIKPVAPVKPRPALPPQANAPKTFTQAVREHLKKLDAAGQFYPPEAITRGLEGDVQVLLVLDESGKVVAARVEQSSGHALLDEAALRAVRSLSSVPADSPRDTFLWLRFRLK